MESSLEALGRPEAGDDAAVGEKGTASPKACDPRLVVAGVLVTDSAASAAAVVAAEATMEQEEEERAAS